MGRVWRENHKELLIQLIKKHEHIWNTKHPRYTRNKRTRHYSWKEITKLFNDSHNEKYTLLEVISKWNNLRLQYQKEHDKVINLKLDRSSWAYYEMLKFLTAHPMQKRQVNVNELKTSSRRKNTKDEESDETVNVSVGSISPKIFRDQDTLSTIVKEEMSSVSEYPKYDQRALENVRTNLETQTSFGEYIAMELTHLDIDLQFTAKKLVFEVLMDLQYTQEQRRRANS